MQVKPINFRGVFHTPTIATAKESRIAIEQGIIAEAKMYPNQARQFTYSDGMQATFKLSTVKKGIVLFLTYGDETSCTIHKL